MPKPSPFGRRLAALREQRGLTQEELEEKSKVSAAMISHFETGARQRASAETLIKLAKALETSVDYLLGRTEEVAPVSGRVAAAFRALSNTSDATIDAAVRVVESLVEMEREKGKTEKNE